MTAMFQKELRDVARWILPAMLITGLLCWMGLPERVSDCNGSAASLAGQSAIASSLFAFCLGLLQSLFDLRTDPRGYLLHRPVTASAIFRSKLAAGFVAHLVAWGIPLLLTGIWLEWQGPEKLPVSWRTAVPAILCCAVSFLFHPTAMWIACRDARWLGTKCLPGVLPLIAVLMTITLSPVPTEQVWIAGLIGGLLALIAIVVVLASHHAFVEETSLPATASDASWSWPNVVGLSVAGLVAVTVSAIVLTEMSGSPNLGDTYVQRVAISDDDTLWEIQEKVDYRVWPQKVNSRTGRILNSDNSTRREIPLGEDWREKPMSTVYAGSMIFRQSLLEDYPYQGTLDENSAMSAYRRSGRLYVYDQWTGLVAVITPRGVFSRDENPSGRFDRPVSLNSFQSGQFNRAIYGRNILADRNGIYQVDVHTGDVRKLSDIGTESLTLTPPTPESPQAELWARSSSDLVRFSVQPAIEGETLPIVVPSDTRAAYVLPQVTLEKTGTWRVGDYLPDANQAQFSVASTSDGDAVFVETGTNRRLKYAVVQNDGSLANSGDFTVQLPPPMSADAAMFFIPPIFVAFVVGMSVTGTVLSLQESLNFAWPILSHSFVAGLFGFWLLRTRVETTRVRIGWIIAAMIFGIGIPLAIVAILRKPVREICSRCEGRRRVDRELCEHCGADWEPTPSDDNGIRLIGPRQVHSTGVAVLG